MKTLTHTHKNLFLYKNKVNIVRCNAVPRTHLVNCLENIKIHDKFFILENDQLGHHKYMHSKYGLLVFSSFEYINVIKLHTNDNPDNKTYIRKWSYKDLMNYINETNIDATVIYNSYCDLLTDTTYFLYYNILPNSFKNNI